MAPDLTPEDRRHRLALVRSDVTGAHGIGRSADRRRDIGGKMLSTAKREGANERHASPLVRSRTHPDGRNCNRRRDFRSSDNKGCFACDVRRPLIRLRADLMPSAQLWIVRFSYVTSLRIERWRIEAVASSKHTLRPAADGSRPARLPPHLGAGLFLSAPAARRNREATSTWPRQQSDRRRRSQRSVTDLGQMHRPRNRAPLAAFIASSAKK